MSDSNNLPLSKTLKDGRLQDFISQAEAAGVGPAIEKEVMGTLVKTIKPNHRNKGDTILIREF